MNDGASNSPASVSLTIPCRAEYVGVARLAILGVASRLNFSYDEVEDLRLAVGEACTSAIDRAGNADDPGASITIDCEIKPTQLTIEVKDEVRGGHSSNGAAAETVPGMDQESIGALLMEILVDSVDVQNDPNRGTTVRLVKNVHLS